MSLANTEQRFWAKVDKTSTCWNWTAFKDRDGYGTFRVTYVGCRRAHRVAYEMLVGPIPAGMTLDHLCRNRACVNPAHLEPCTAGENVMRGNTPAAINAAKMHCPVGHPYDAENTFYEKKGSRSCRECRRKASREAQRRRAAQRREAA